MIAIWFIIGVIIIYAVASTVAMIFDNKKYDKKTNIGFTFLAFIVGGIMIFAIFYFVDK